MCHDNPVCDCDRPSSLLGPNPLGDLVNPVTTPLRRSAIPPPPPFPQHARSQRTPRTPAGATRTLRSGRTPSSATSQRTFQLSLNLNLGSPATTPSRGTKRKALTVSGSRTFKRAKNGASAYPPSVGPSVSPQRLNLSTPVLESSSPTSVPAPTPPSKPNNSSRVDIWSCMRVIESEERNVLYRKGLLTRGESPLYTRPPIAAFVGCILCE